MSRISERIRKLRETEGLTRKQLSEKTGINIRTIEAIEQDRNEPSLETLGLLSKQWPMYSHWILTNETDAKTGQTSPEIEQKRKDSKGDEREAG